MEALKYKVITSDKQYDKYCKTLEELVFSSPKTKANKDEIALLTLLIEKYDEEHNIFELAEPVALLKSLMKDHKMKAVDLAKLLDVSEGLVSDILNYKKGLSKKNIRVLAETFKVSQEAFNRPYQLILPDSKNRSKSKSKYKLASMS
jgi:HTH-type transcriptional regulator/antitoxin HigA